SRGGSRACACGRRCGGGCRRASLALLLRRDVVRRKELMTCPSSALPTSAAKMPHRERQSQGETAAGRSSPRPVRYSPRPESGVSPLSGIAGGRAYLVKSGGNNDAFASDRLPGGVGTVRLLQARVRQPASVRR